MGMITRMVRRHNDGDDDGDGNDDDYGTNMVLMTASTTSPYLLLLVQRLPRKTALAGSAPRHGWIGQADRSRPKIGRMGDRGPQRQRTVDEASQPTLDRASSCFYYLALLCCYVTLLAATSHCLLYCCARVGSTQLWRA